MNYYKSFLFFTKKDVDKGVPNVLCGLKQNESEN